MSEPRPGRTETDEQGPPLTEDAAPERGARTYQRPERQRSSSAAGWLVALVILVVLGYLLFRFVI